MNCLVLVFSSNHAADSDVFEILSIISNRLHAIDIYLDILLPKLDPWYLDEEISSFPAEVVITTVITFLEYLITITEVSAHSTDRIKKALQRPHFENYKNRLSSKTKQSITALNENVVL
ncbi:hypothetical protein RMATCC62417_09528 [Rhizopus microsporus]|nr:hypothetical protein RMATCC62417_09528 [Rhizopus microsporus]